LSINEGTRFGSFSSGIQATYQDRRFVVAVLLDVLQFLFTLTALIVISLLFVYIALLLQAYNGETYRVTASARTLQMLESRSRDEYAALSPAQDLQVRDFVRSLRQGSAEPIDGAASAYPAAIMVSGPHDVIAVATEIRARSEHLQRQALARTRRVLRRADSVPLASACRIAKRELGLRRRRLSVLAVQELGPRAVRRLTRTLITHMGVGSVGGGLVVCAVVLMSSIGSSRLDFTGLALAAPPLLGSIVGLASGTTTVYVRVLRLSPHLRGDPGSLEHRRVKHVIWLGLPAVTVAVAAMLAFDLFQRWQHFSMSAVSGFLDAALASDTGSRAFGGLLTLLSLTGLGFLVRAEIRSMRHWPAEPWSSQLKGWANAQFVTPMVLAVTVTSANAVAYPDILVEGRGGPTLVLTGTQPLLVICAFVCVLAAVPYAGGLVAAARERHVRLSRFRALGLEVARVRSPWLIGGAWAGCWTAIGEVVPLVFPALNTTTGEFSARAYPAEALLELVLMIAILLSFGYVSWCCWRAVGRRRQQEQYLAAEARRLLSAGEGLAMHQPQPSHYG